MSVELLPTALLCDAAVRRVAMHARIRPMWLGARLAGPAFTVQTNPGEFAGVRAAVEMAAAGDVLVVDGGAALECALWGDRMSRLALERGIAGIVIDGATRDVEEISNLRFPVFAVGAAPSPPGRERPGEIGVAIQCGGRPVSPGDLIFGDGDGVVVLPKADAPDVIAQANTIAAKEGLHE